MTTTMRRRALTPYLLPALALLAPMLAGCQLFGFMAQSVAGGKKIKARYEPSDIKTVVFIDDPTNKLPSVALAGDMARKIGTELVEQRVLSAPNVVPTVQLDELRNNERDFAAWPIDRVGAKLEAQQVIYVLVNQFHYSNPNRENRPSLEVQVKVVSTKDGRRLWPTDGSDGAPLMTFLWVKNFETTDVQRSLELLVGRQLVEEAAVTVAKLFYEHEPKPIGQGLGK